MKVNMTPNPLDVVTIHASQGDTEARQWEFELHNNGELIDTNEITEQMFFKAYKGGTEQLLPENGSTPTTSPFKGDIRYPQGLLTDQEFTYRQSPSEEDGLAKITDIKGNTLVWNQLVQNGNFADTSKWLETRGTISASSNVLSYTISEVGSSIMNRIQNNNAPLIQNHKYLMAFDIKPLYTNNIYCFSVTSTYGVNTVATLTPSSANTWNRMSCIFTNSLQSTLGVGVAFECSTNYALNDVIQLRNYVLFDLTKMGLDITSPSDFTSLFSLPYYDYNQGSLLSFMGNGIKTTGKNQFNSEHAISATNIVESNDNGTITIKDASSITWSNAYIGYSDVIAGKEYTFKASLKYGRIGGNLSGTSHPIPDNQPDTNIGDLIFAAVTSAMPSRTFIPNFTGRIYWWYCTDIGNANHQQFVMQPMLSTMNADFEPYTSSTLSLPISTYFPTGMKSAGSVYDELTPTKAITRIGVVDLGSLTWTYDSSVPRFYTTDINTLIKKPANIYVEANAVSSMYVSTTFDKLYTTEKKNMTMAFGDTGTFSVINTSYSDANAFKTAMNGVYLYYELATPTETSFTTASLVTENAEIPLSNEDGVLIGKCTEQLSENPGFFDAKIKLADADGECYSNKIQLHVERSPQ